MDVNDVASLLGAVGGISAAVFAGLGYRHQIIGARRPAPIFELETAPSDKGWTNVYIVVRNQSRVTCELINVKIVGRGGSIRSRDGKDHGKQYALNEWINPAGSTKPGPGHIEFDIRSDGTESAVQIKYRWRDQDRLKSSRKLRIMNRS